MLSRLQDFGYHVPHILSYIFELVTHGATSQVACLYDISVEQPTATLLPSQLSAGIWRLEAKVSMVRRIGFRYLSRVPVESAY